MAAARATERDGHVVFADAADVGRIEADPPLEMLGRTRFPPIGELPYMITLAPYGFYWFQLQIKAPSMHEAPPLVGCEP